MTETMTNTQATNAAYGFAGGVFAMMMMMLLIFYVLVIIADWKIFTKAGEKGWKSLIPIYSNVISFKIVGISPWWVLGLFGAAMFLPSTTADGQQVVFQWYNCIALVALAAIQIYYSIKLADAFGKGTGLKIGLILLPNIFILILGFGNAEYQLKK